MPRGFWAPEAKRKISDARLWSRGLFNSLAGED